MKSSKITNKNKVWEEFYPLQQGDYALSSGFTQIIGSHLTSQSTHCFHVKNLCCTACCMATRDHVLAWYLAQCYNGIQIARRNTNNLGYANDTTLMAESKEDPKSLLMKVKEESEKVSLKLNIQKTRITASGPIISWQMNGETMETVRDFIFLGSKITADGDCSHEIKRCLLLERKVMTNLDSILKSRDITLPTKVYLVKATVFQ